MISVWGGTHSPRTHAYIHIHVYIHRGGGKKEGREGVGKKGKGRKKGQKEEGRKRKRLIYMPITKLLFGQVD